MIGFIICFTNCGEVFDIEGTALAGLQLLKERVMDADDASDSRLVTLIRIRILNHAQWNHICLMTGF